MNSKVISASLPTPPINLCPKPPYILQPQLPFNKSHFPPIRSNTNSSSSRSSGHFRPMAAAAAATITAPAASVESFYDLLGIPETVSFSEIKSAYKRMALKYHPDVSPPGRTEEYTRRFIRVQEAYNTLSDPKSRAMYDSDMTKGMHLVFSGRKGVRFDPRSEGMDGWKSMWESQISELKRRAATNSRVDSGGKDTWGARIRKQRAASFSGGLD